MELRDLRELRDRRVTSAMTALKAGSVGVELLVLDEDDLALLVHLGLEAFLDDLVGLRGLADVRVGGLEVLRADRMPIANEATTKASQPNTAVFQ